MKLNDCIRNLLRDDRGQTTTEYILILSVVVMIALRFKTVFGQKMVDMVNTLGGKIDTGINDAGSSGSP